MALNLSPAYDPIRQTAWVQDAIRLAAQERERSATLAAAEKQRQAALVQAAIQDSRRAFEFDRRMEFDRARTAADDARQDARLAWEQQQVAEGNMPFLPQGGATPTAPARPLTTRIAPPAPNIGAPASPQPGFSINASAAPEAAPFSQLPEEVAPNIAPSIEGDLPLMSESPQSAARQIINASPSAGVAIQNYRNDLARDGVPDKVAKQKLASFSAEARLKEMTPPRTPATRNRENLFETPAELLAKYPNATPVFDAQSGLLRPKFAEEDPDKERAKNEGIVRAQEDQLLQRRTAYRQEVKDLESVVMKDGAPITPTPAWAGDGATGEKGKFYTMDMTKPVNAETGMRPRREISKTEHDSLVKKSNELTESQKALGKAKAKLQTIHDELETFGSSSGSETPAKTASGVSGVPPGSRYLRDKTTGEIHVIGPDGRKLGILQQSGNGATN